MKKLIPLFILFTFLLTGCGEKTPPPARTDITGIWDFEMTKLFEEETLYDKGTITFTGTPSDGEFILISENGLEISGTYFVGGISFSFESDQDFIIQGSLPSENEIFGSWEVTNMEDLGGLFVADRR